jgi:transposase
MPHSVDALLRVVQARDAEGVLLKLMVQKLKLQLARRNRTVFGSSSKRFEDGQSSLIEPALLDGIAASKTPAKPVSPAANTGIDRSLPAHLPRDEQVHRPETTAAHHDNDGQACGRTACGGRLRRIGVDVSERLEYVPSHFKVIRQVRPKLACVKCQSISDAGGERAAAMYSLVETAKLNGLDPQAYLREVFARIAEHPINRSEELLPWNSAAKPEARKMAA